MHMRRFLVFAVVLAFFLGACGRKEEKKPVEEKKEVQEEPREAPQPVPAGHPPLDEAVKGMVPEHAGVKKGDRPVELSADIKARWKDVELEVTDNSTRAKDVLKARVGSSVALKTTEYSFRVEAFVPDYMIMDKAIVSKSREPNNPAALIELFEGGKSVAKGWVFKRFPDFNSYKHERFAVVLLTPTSVKQ